jgi:hypothetical protein
MLARQRDLVFDGQQGPPVAGRGRHDDAARSLTLARAEIGCKPRVPASGLSTGPNGKA